MAHAYPFGRVSQLFTASREEPA